MLQSEQNQARLASLVSGERFTARYLLSAPDLGQAEAMARDIGLEQTVEFPADLVPPGPIAEAVVGRLEGIIEAGEGRYLAEISFAVETTSDSVRDEADVAQLLNVAYGNISIKPNIRLVGLSLPDVLLRGFPGPRFGRQGLRDLLGVPRRPLTSTALKPMGLSARELAEQAYLFALGGIDLIKDDHGLSDQVFAPFEERVGRCAEAVDRANRETGFRSLYMANVTGRMDRILPAARRAKELGAGALLISPALTGFDALRLLAEDEELRLPLMAHPSFGGVMATSPTCGISHSLLYGTFMRLCGADASVYPNFGGRFSFSKEECIGIARATSEPLGALRTAFPAPGGGMTPERTVEMLDVYGRDFVLLVGAGLHRGGPDLAENARRLLALLESTR